MELGKIMSDAQFEKEMQAELDTGYSEASGDKASTQRKSKAKESEIDDPLAGDTETDELDNDELPVDEVDNSTEMDQDDDESTEESVEDDETDDDEDLFGDLDPPEDSGPELDEKDPPGVNRKIQKEWKRRKEAEKKAEMLEARLRSIETQMVPMQQQANPQVHPSQLPEFVPPPLPKPFDQMDEFEKFTWMKEVDKRQLEASQASQQRQAAESRYRNQVTTLVSELNLHRADPIMAKVLNPETTPFSNDMGLALRNYPDKVNIFRYLHEKKMTELREIRQLPPVEQREEMIKLASQFHVAKQEAYKKKVGQSKPAPGGKLKAAGAPVNHGKKDIYSNQKYLDSLTPSQIDKLIQKGY